MTYWRRERRGETVEPKDAQRWEMEGQLQGHSRLTLMDARSQLEGSYVGAFTTKIKKSRGA